MQRSLLFGLSETFISIHPLSYHWQSRRGSSPLPWGPNPDLGSVARADCYLLLARRPQELISTGPSSLVPAGLGEAPGMGMKAQVDPTEAFLQPFSAHEPLQG